MALNVRHIMARLCKAWKVTTYKELAEKLTLGESTPSSWATKNQIPYAACLKTVEQCGCSFDWLLFGEQAQSLAEPALQEAVAAALKTAHELDLIDLSNEVVIKALTKLLLRECKKKEWLVDQQPGEQKVSPAGEI